MIVLGWIVVLIGGLAVVLYASTKSVTHARLLAQGTRIPPFFIGVTLLSVGTDLPEIANSIAACAAGHGDLNVGDSVGSAVTQATLVLGLLPILGGVFVVERRRVMLVIGACVAALAFGASLMLDGELSRADGLLLVGLWVAGSLVIWRQLEPVAGANAPPSGSGRMYHVGATLFFLVAVGAGATAVVSAFIRLSEVLGVPEYFLAFFVASIGTSLPELVVDVTALRRGFRDMAMGDVLGSSFVDATLSLGIGPLLIPTSVTASIAVFGSMTAVVVMGLVILILGPVSRHTRFTGVLLLGVYVALYLTVLAWRPVT